MALIWLPAYVYVMPPPTASAKLFPGSNIAMTTRP